ncbi:cyanocobalamin reductase / alkylcobalamin dealkylase-like [Branchiostoma floridae]|uniref:Cyanocobalamin reductase / alkylcobalamin dealkylase n=2 Tax=Branchiostoma floridae TaxID=7739 RepID=A0A9J7MDE2_BRAFL|nr:cyanocobalamin reductase / alkylcobalamin dealkylase-like [Branchiostoma floridae]
MDRATAIWEQVEGYIRPLGLESYPFKIQWYNDKVKDPFPLPYPGDTLAVVILSTPNMFEKAFKPFVAKKDCYVRDPIDECLLSHMQNIKAIFPDEDIDCMQDFELHPNHRPKVLVQTAAHVAGAARYYQRMDVKEDPWGKDKNIYGVSVHPKYGGWFAIRAVLVFKNILVPEMEYKEPPDCVPTDELRIDLLNKYNFHWKDWSFRDVIPVEDKYSEEQKVYFDTPPADRKALLGLEDKTA